MASFTRRIFLGQGPHNAGIAEFGEKIFQLPDRRQKGFPPQSSLRHQTGQRLQAFHPRADEVRTITRIILEAIQGAHGFAEQLG
jgi:hypothetical protein